MKDCPVCRSSLKEVPRYGVIIDVCPDCRGVWLDKGELDKILSLARDFEGGRNDYDKPERRDDYDGHIRDDYHDRGRYYDKHEHHRKKKKGGIFDVLGDLFD